MLEQYIVKDGKRMRYGYTTGSCAAAAAKAAAIMALMGKPIKDIEINTPKGWNLALKIETWKIEGTTACCTIKKDGGDDPDNTHGILVGAAVELTDSPGVLLKGGKGVGIVTKPGLQVPPGEPAINPVPRAMIQKEVLEVLPEGKGAIITIFVPEGEAIAKKTFNPRLGILGGISILGTTGIVEPMSEEAFKESLALELKMAVQEGLDQVILVPGNHGRDLAYEHYGFSKDKVIKTSNFVGFMLEKCTEYGIKKVLMIGHIGKFVKLAGGIFHTHSKVADSRIEILAGNLALLGAPQSLIKELFNCVTTEAALTLIEENGYESLYAMLCTKAEQKCMQHVYESMEVGIIMFSMDKRILGIGPNGKKLLEAFAYA
ncbi:cobalt-precorrin-5B (C(1))-methyltransferase CbiD [Geosporobacter ferrireducens]|uniref:Cobalt-precorrin-5B C(1)-methyltransferase n=1 Tax=Geosporobacter ferrireducens TaxID=1424294 RepID=A0A1D8GNC2_9FIRM|nr:cobalt-precorrin-5B (C(1))-methyltransferase CbiD [Geosporobacter ferrireducens]AOT72384.1 cobalt-precorrin-5B (C(1))-methyltransferase [Geosporobacter ferrireducens]MTI56360.1 cobalamin biosynthesis protein CbiD [Geosporobacter ferrireducens]